MIRAKALGKLPTPNDLEEVESSVSLSKLMPSNPCNSRLLSMDKSNGLVIAKRMTDQNKSGRPSPLPASRHLPNEPIDMCNEPRTPKINLVSKPYKPNNEKPPYKPAPIEAVIEAVSKDKRRQACLSQLSRQAPVSETVNSGIEISDDEYDLLDDASSTQQNRLPNMQYPHNSSALLADSIDVSSKSNTPPIKIRWPYQSNQYHFRPSQAQYEPIDVDSDLQEQPPKGCRSNARQPTIITALKSPSNIISSLKYHPAKPLKKIKQNTQTYQIANSNLAVTPRQLKPLTTSSKPPVKDKPKRAPKNQKIQYPTDNISSNALIKQIGEMVYQKKTTIPKGRGKSCQTNDDLKNQFISNLSKHAGYLKDLLKQSEALALVFDRPTTEVFNLMIESNFDFETVKRKLLLDQVSNENTSTNQLQIRL